MATIRRRGDRYHVQFRRKGFAPVTRSFLKLSDAKEWARLTETKADRHELAPKKEELAHITLGDLVRRYQDEVLPKLKAADREGYIVGAFLRHPICKKPLSDLSARDFVRYRDERLKDVTPKSLSRTLSPIKHMFRLAVDEWDIPLKENPLSKLRLKVIDNKRQRRLMDGELEQLLKHAVGGARSVGREHTNRKRNPFLPLVIRFAVETAMRRGEMLSLCWPQVDLKRAAVTILDSKNGYSRTIPLTAQAISVLHEAEALKAENEDRVFPMSPNGLLLSWSRLVERAGIVDLHFHDLRHEAISRLFELGLSAPEVASISGHRDMRMLFRYAHANNANVRAKLAGQSLALPES